MAVQSGRKQPLSKEQVIQLLDLKAQDPSLTDDDIAEQVGCGRATVGRYWKKYRNGEEIAQLQGDYEAKKKIEDKKEEQDAVKDVEELDEVVDNVTEILTPSEPIVDEVIDTKITKKQLDENVEVDNITEEDKILDTISENVQEDNPVKDKNTDENVANTPSVSDIKLVYDAIGQKDIALAIFSESRRYGYLNFPQFVVEHLLPWWDIKVKLEDYWDNKFTPQEFISMLKELLKRSGEKSTIEQEFTQMQTEYAKVSSEYNALKAAINAAAGGIKVDT